MLLRSKMRRLPPVHLATLKAVVEHLARVAAQSDKNKMDAKNLAIIFGTVIFGEDEMPKNGDLLSVQGWKVASSDSTITHALVKSPPQDSLMEDLINNAQLLFDDQPQTHPLPPPPVGETPAAVTHGSQHTRVGSVPATPSLSIQNHSEDFTPQPPVHPPKSIHPSARSNPPPSPTKDRSMAGPPPQTPVRRTGELQSPPQSPSRMRTDLPSIFSQPSTVGPGDSSDDDVSSTSSATHSRPPTITSIDPALDPFVVPMPSNVSNSPP